MAENEERESQEHEGGLQHEGSLEPATEAEEKVVPLSWGKKVAATEAPVDADAQETARGIFAHQEVQWVNISERGVSGGKSTVFQVQRHERKVSPKSSTNRFARTWGGGGGGGGPQTLDTKRNKVQTPEFRARLQPFQRGEGVLTRQL